MATEALRARESRVLTIPNLVTFLRLGSIPVFEWLLLSHGRKDWLAAAVLLAAIGITDFLDGFLARRLHQVSNLGKILDPVADRLVLGVAGISVLAVGGMPLWVGVVALVRETVVNVGGLIAALAGGRRIDVSRWGKAGTFGLLVAFPLFLGGHSTVGWAQGFEDAAWVFAIPALVLGWVALATYVPIARRAVVE
ncbi:MAG: CDP-alcohol phosphatidyltransferase family protein, partial [Acidimicrobiales bacterium]